MARNRSLRNFRFRLEIDGIAQAGFSEVAIGETTIDAVDYREGTDPPHVRKLTGLTKYGNITLKWGCHRRTALDLFKWHNDVSPVRCRPNRKKVAIIVQDEAGADAGALRRQRGLADASTTRATSTPKATKS